MTNKEKLNIIYERMGGYTNPRKDDKTGWIIYDQNPVLIGDVLDWFDKGLEIFLDVNNDKGHDIYKDIIALWQNKRLPIDEQSDECIDFVYALTKE